MVEKDDTNIRVLAAAGVIEIELNHGGKRLWRLEHEQQKRASAEK